MGAKEIAAASLASVAVAGSAAIAHADNLYQFQSPTGNISCVMAALTGGPPHVSCEDVDHTWAIPPRPQSCLGAWGDRIAMVQGSPPGLSCHTDTTRGSGLPTLQYGDTRSVGMITCESKPNGIACADSSTGHSFRISRESYDLK